MICLMTLNPVLTLLHMVDGQDKLIVMYISCDTPTDNGFLKNNYWELLHPDPK